MIDVVPPETNTCYPQTAGYLWLTNSYWGSGGLEWSVNSNGLSWTSNEGLFTFNPSNSTPGQYIVTARALGWTQCCDVATVRVFRTAITEIKGLYTSNGTYVAGYTSTDDVGRIYSSRVYCPTNLSQTIWSNHTQYIDITVMVSSTNVPLPSDARIVWEVEDPDDPSDSGMTEDAAAVIDPNGSAGNDNTGTNDSATVWEQIGSYTLDGTSNNETAVSNGISKVRFNATDHGGDNFIVRAKLKLNAGATPLTNDQTGVMTVWKRIDVEYVRMQGSGGGADADAVPTDLINEHYKKSFVQFDVLSERLVAPEYVNYYSNYWAVGMQDTSASGADYAPSNQHAYCTQAAGEFSKQDKGWYFIAAAHDWTPLGTLKSLILYPRPVEQYDDADQLSDWAFGGASKGTNTDANYKLYVQLDHPSDARIRIYKDAGFTNLVAEGAGPDGSIELQTRNNSGLYGFVKLEYSANDTNIVLTLADHGPAWIAGAPGTDEKHDITLNDPLPSGPGIDNLYEIEGDYIDIFKSNLSTTVYFTLNTNNITPDRETVYAQAHWYSPFDDPNSYTPKYLTDHGWTNGDTVEVTVHSPGGYGTSGRNDAETVDTNSFFNGRVMYFSWSPGSKSVTTLHELGHALGFAHRCGNLDFEGAMACFMEYAADWLLSTPWDPDPAARTPVPWTSGRGLEMCPYHIKGIRETVLEDDTSGRKLRW